MQTGSILLCHWGKLFRGNMGIRGVLVLRKWCSCGRHICALCLRWNMTKAWNSLRYFCLWRRTIDRNFIGLLSWAFFFFCCTCWPQIVENRNISLPGLLPVGKVHALSSQLCHPLSTFTFSYDFCPEPRHLGCSIMPTKLQAGMMGEPLCLCNSTELCPVFCGEHLSCSGHRFGQERLKTCNEMLLQIVLHAVPVIPLDAQATCQSAC